MKKGLLPDHYQEYKTVSLQQNRRMGLWLDVIRLVILLGLGSIGIHLLPAALVPQKEVGIQLATALLGIMLCLLFHEWIHGLMMKILGGGKLKYGFVGWIPRISSRNCFSKGAGSVILLMPWLVLGLLIGILQNMVAEAWEWVLFAIQVANWVAASADVWNLVIILCQPKEAMICLSGNQMIVYVPEDTGK